jgi:cyclohexanecarboxylate-CoA ligase
VTGQQRIHAAASTDFRAALTLRPPRSDIERFRQVGAWREESPLDDLWRWREETPDAVAVVAQEAGSGAVRLTYREYAEHVERFAGALYELGVRPGGVVAIQVPNRWQVNALLLACARIGAVFAPIMTTIRQRELERVLRRTGAEVCVTVDRWAGFDHSSVLAELAGSLPDLRHRVVLGDAVADDEIDFARHFEQTPWERTHADALGALTPDPDQVGLVLFTSGTSGEPKAALRTYNSVHAILAVIADVDRHGPQDTFATASPVSHLGGIIVVNLLPLLVGGTAVFMDAWEPAEAIGLLAESGTTTLWGAPAVWAALIAELRQHPRSLPALRTGGAMGTAILAPLVTEVAEVLGLSLRGLWGSTEAAGTITRLDDPPDWAARSVGRPYPGVEIDLRSKDPVTVERPARVYLRGSGLCLATVGRDSGEVTVLAEHDEGWYDTGDLAVPDGRGGIRLLGRATDRIGGSFMIPIEDVESTLLDHPAVDEVAVVGYPDGDGGELACAVIVSRTAPPTLADVRAYLDERGMTQWYQPSRVEPLHALPRNETGKVRKELLRRWLRGETELNLESSGEESERALFPPTTRRGG